MTPPQGLSRPAHVLLLLISSSVFVAAYELDDSAHFHRLQHLQHNLKKHKYDDPSLDCSFRTLAYQYGQRLLNGGGPSLYAALALSECSSTPLVSGLQHVVQEHQFAKDNRRHGWSGAEDGIEYYVSANDGSDSNPGTLQKPFQTIQRAQFAIRTIPVKKRPAVTVYLREGVYYQDETIFFGPSDSGSSAQQPIVYTPYKNEQVTISGGKKLALQWKPYKNGVWVAQLNEPLTFTSLFVNGQRQILARFPNGDPTVPGQGYIQAGYGLPNLPNNPIPASVSTPQRPHASWGNFETGAGGQLDRYTAFSAPFYGSEVPPGFYYNKTTWTKKTWKNPQLGIVQMFHPYLWGNWQFQIQSLDPVKGIITFSKGGFQEGRGGPIQGNAYYVENIFEELDHPNEWFLDVATSQLYYYPPQGLDINSVDVVAVLVDNIIQTQGNFEYPVKHIKFVGFNITHSATTYMSTYEVPSGGDWSIHRGGAVLIEGGLDITVDNCVFDQPGGNGVFLSNYAENCTVSANEFVSMGDSAVAAVGTSQMIVATKYTYPFNNRIVGNHIHDIGIFGKQTAGYFQSVARSNVIAGNVIYNGPRAGICFNDGFGGGNLIESNLLFNLVRETGDHGPFNSWDRQPYIFDASDDGQGGHNVVFHPNINTINSNFMINTNYLGSSNGVWNIDHDDGSSHYNDTKNFLIYGGVKYRDGLNRSASQNVLYEVGPWHAADFQVLYNNSVDAFTNNIAINPTGEFYGCVWLPPFVPAFVTANNAFFTPNNLTLPFTTPGCSKNPVSGLSNWQKYGYDKGSTISSHISASDIINLGKKVLGM